MSAAFRKTILILFLTLLLFFVSACSNNPDTIEYDGEAVPPEAVNSYYVPLAFDVNKMAVSLSVDGHINYWDAPTNEVVEYDNGEILDFSLLHEAPEGFSCIGTAGIDYPFCFHRDDINLESPCASVYASSHIEGVLYLRFTETLIRFVAPDLHTDYSIFWDGRIYSKDLLNPEFSDSLPLSAKYAGTLSFIGVDEMPKEDLQTNDLSINGCQISTGTDVYCDTASSDLLYVYKGNKWQVYR